MRYATWLDPSSPRSRTSEDNHTASAQEKGEQNVEMVRLEPSRELIQVGAEGVRQGCGEVTNEKARKRKSGRVPEGATVPGILDGDFG